MSIVIQDPIASIVLGINSTFFTTPDLKDDHLIFLIRDLLATDFPDYKINCYIDNNQKNKYLFDIHNAQLLFENATLKQDSNALGSLHFPDLEESLLECLDDFEIRFSKSIYPEFIEKLNLDVTEQEVADVAQNSISYCYLQKELQNKVKSYNQMLLDSEFDYSGFSFFLNYGDGFEIYLMDYKNNTVGHFKNDINKSLINFWINTIGVLRATAKQLGYDYVKENNNARKNQFETFITPTISSDTFLDDETYTALLNKADNDISNEDQFNEIKQIRYSVFMLFKESFSDGMAERCYDLTYNPDGAATW